ncbi:MAG: N-acetylmuramoyl-L-alanine amidase [Bacteroidales bacterium]
MPLQNNTSFIILLLSFLLIVDLPCFSQGSAPHTQIKTVVIDPGHGGKHPGAISKNGKYKEKDITLSVGLKLGNLIKEKYPDIKIIYTRTTDKYVDLDERANIANQNKANLFISIHVNSTKSTQASGTETFVMGTHKSDDNFEVCKTENSVIVMEDNYKTKYEGFNPDSPESYIIFTLLQNTHLEQSLSLAAHIQEEFKQGPIYNSRGVKQGGLLVLWKTTMPSILTEIGFISNANDYNVLISNTGQTQLAIKLFNAFVDYKAEYETGYGVIPISTSDSVIQKEPAVEIQPSSKLGFYAVQILSVNKILRKKAADFKGEKGYEYIKVNNFYKYYIGKYKTRNEAAEELSTIRNKFNGAFIIYIEDNKIVK